MTVNRFPVARREGQGLVVTTPYTGPISISLTSVEGGRVICTIDAPTDCSVHRDEVYDVVKAQRRKTV